MTEIAKTPAIERIARVLAARALSANAEGAEVSASSGVDATWPAHEADAVAILRTLREPDAAMAAVGDASLWEAMVLAALGIAPNESGSPTDEGFASIGADPFIEGP